MKNSKGWLVFYDKSKRCWRLKVKKPDGSWKASSNLPQTITNQRAAEQYVKASGLVSVDIGTELVQKPGPQRDPLGKKSLRVAELQDKWFTYRRETAALAKRQPATIKNNLTHFTTWIKPHCGHLLMTEFNTVPELRKFIRIIKAANSVSHCRNIFSTAKRFIQDCIAEGWVPMGLNWCNDPNVLEQVPDSEIEDVLTVSADTAQKLLDAEKVPIERRIKMAVMFNSGLVDGEIHGGLWRNVTVDPRVRISPLKDDQGVCAEWRVEQACKLIFDPKTGKLGTPKTSSRLGVVPLTPCAAMALNWWYHVGWEDFVGRKPQPDDPVFPDRFGHPNRWDHPAEAFREDLEAAECSAEVNGKPLTVHAARRFFSTTLEQHDVPAGAIKRLMRHRITDVTAKHYTKATPQQLMKWVCRIPLRWNGPTVGGKTAEAKLAEAEAAKLTEQPRSRVRRRGGATHMVTGARRPRV